MHRGTIFIIFKDKNNCFKVQKSTEFNGGMGIDNDGKEIYTMLMDFKKPELFDKLIRDFDKKYYGYNDEIMTYFPDEQKSPYINENGNEYFEYAQTKNQFKFFKDDNGEYIYTSDSNYIKNMSNEDITVVCSNGNYVLKPNQILITDYSRCINNSRISFGKFIDKHIQIDKLETKKYIETRKQEIMLDNIVDTLESFNYEVHLLKENGVIKGIELETWTSGGVNMIHEITFDDFQDSYDRNNVEKEIQEICDNFSIDDEIDIYRQNQKYKENFTIKESLDDFTEYQEKLNNLANNFRSKYFEIAYKKSVEKDEEKELI